MTEAGSSLLDQTLAAYVAAVVPFGVGHRDVSGPDGAGQLVTLLREIDETILPRRLVFNGDGGTRLTLDVADRHIQGVVAVSGLVANGPEFSIIGQVLAHPTEAEVAQLCRLLTTFTADRRSLLVRTARGLSGSSAGAMGVSISRLRQFDATPVPLIDRFIARLGVIPAALLLTRPGQVVEGFGDVSHLQELAENLTDALGEEPAGAAGQMIILATDDAKAMLFADAEGTQLLVGFAATDALAVAALWLDCKARSV